MSPLWRHHPHLSDWSIEMNNEPDAFGVIIAVVVAILLAFGFFGIGYISAEKTYQKQAVAHGYATWEIKDDKGNTEFKWIKKNDKVEPEGEKK